jgi:GNAT superfamily N-acetyltransferase
MSATLAPSWLFEFDQRLFDGFGQRMDVAGLRRWSNPEFPTLRDGNHAAVGPDDGLIPDQLVQIFDAQCQDGAGRKCIDIYGLPDDRDRLALEMGMERQNEAPIHVFLFHPERTPAPLPAVTTLERAAPPVWELDRKDWVDTVELVHKRELLSWERDIVMAEAVMECASFYSIRIGETAVAAVARYDFPGASQVASLYTETAFRKTGFGQACLARAIHATPTRAACGLIAGNNEAMLAVAARAGGDLVLKDPRRRYVGTW